MSAGPSQGAESEPGLAEFLGSASSVPVGGRPRATAVFFWVSQPTRNPNHSLSTRQTSTGDDCEKIKHGDVTLGSGWDTGKPCLGALWCRGHCGVGGTVV